MRWSDFFIGKNIFYFSDCICYFKYKENFELYKKIFKELGIKFEVVDKHICSGYELWEAGYDSEMRKLIKKNLDFFKENKIRKIFSTEPGAYKMFVKDYKEILPYWDIEVVNIWELILEKLKKKSFNNKDDFITYHDSCYLGRYCGIYDAPREILKLIGYKIKEMDNNKENSFCCGSCGGLLRTNPEIANKVARERLLQAKRIGVDKMVVIGFENYNILKNNSKDFGIEIFELSEILADALGIKELDKKEEIVINKDG